jgi:tRNA(adenine34) deaminase
MLANRRHLLAGAFAGLICLPGAKPAKAALPPISPEKHERYMRLAIEQGKKNPYFPFGAVIVRPATDEVVATGINDARANPTLHGEIVCLNDYIAHNGNKGFEELVLYTTCEPCPMCMTALLFARIGGVVFATFNAEGLKKAGFDSIKISARQLVDATPFSQLQLLQGGVLAAETDRMFLERKRY